MEDEGEGDKLYRDPSVAFAAGGESALDQSTNAMSNGLRVNVVNSGRQNCTDAGLFAKLNNHVEGGCY